MDRLFTNQNSDQNKRNFDNIVDSDIVDNQLWDITDPFDWNFNTDQTTAPEPIAQEVVIQTKPEPKKRGRPPIKDPEEKKRRRRERERIAAQKYRKKKKMMEALDESEEEHNRQLNDKNKEKLSAIVEEIGPYMEWAKNEAEFSPSESKAVKASLRRISKILSKYQK